MKKEDKELLIKDLCARLPYDVYAETVNELGETHINRICSENINFVTSGWFKECKPYLRPLSSMTEEEKEEYWLIRCPQYDENGNIINTDAKLFDWLNSHHFDYRGLIEKGLALEAPKDMYKI